MIALLACLALTVQAQKKPAAPVKQKTASATPIIQTGTVLIYSITGGSSLTIRITNTAPLSFDYVITGGDEYHNGSYSHSAAFLKSGRIMISPFKYRELNYSNDQYLTVWLSKDMSAAFKAGKSAELEFEGDEMISFGDVSTSDFSFNLHPKYFNRETNYTSEIKYVHGIKREFKSYNASSTEDATLIIWTHPSWPLLLYLSLPDGIEMRLEAIL